MLWINRYPFGIRKIKRTGECAFMPEFKSDPQLSGGGESLDFLREIVRRDKLAGTYGGRGGTRAAALPPRAERLPPHRSRQIDLPELRHRKGFRRGLPSAVRRHEPGDRGHEVRRGDHARRAGAGVRLGGKSVFRLGLLRATLRIRGPAHSGREG